MLKLTYKKRTYDLVLFDSYYIQTKQPYFPKHYAELETIINSLQERAYDQNYKFTITLNGQNFDATDVHNYLLNN